MFWVFFKTWLIYGCREWRQFNYPSRNLRFVSQNESKGGDFLGGVSLPQFSSATVPKVRDVMITRLKIGLVHFLLFLAFDAFLINVDSLVMIGRFFI